jgi:hypothetical protein
MSGTSPPSLHELLTIAEAHGELWALFVRHGDAVTELHKTDTYKVYVENVEIARRALEEWLQLVVEEPVSCVDAVCAEVELLRVCRDCEHFYVAVP